MKQSPERSKVAPLDKLGHLRNFESSPGIRTLLQFHPDRPCFWMLPNSHRYMDMVIAQRDDQGIYQPRNAEFFGISHCIGVKLIEESQLDPVVFSTIFEHTHNQLRTKELLGEPVLMTNTDLADWSEYYAQVLQVSMVKLGSKRHELSGLTRSSPRYTRELYMATQELFGNGLPSQELASYGVDQVQSMTYQDQTLLEVALWDKHANPMLIPLAHTRSPYWSDNEIYLDGQILREVVADETKLCLGAVVLRPGENKREAYLRAEMARKLLLADSSIQQYIQEAADRHSLEPNQFMVPVVSGGQLSLWRKLGLTKTVPSIALLRYLFLGVDNVDRGVLAQFHAGHAEVSLPIVRQANAQGVDLSPTFELKRPLPFPIAAINLSRYKRKFSPDGSEISTMPLANVRGFTMVSSDTHPEEIVRIIKGQERILQNGPFPNSRVVIVTPELMEEWQRTGVVSSKEDFQRAQTESVYRRSEYFDNMSRNGRGIQVYYARYQAGPGVGGMVDGIIVTSGDTVVFHPSNLGDNFSPEYPQLKASITARPSVAVGIQPYLVDGSVPMIPSLIAIEQLVRGAGANIGHYELHEKDVVSRFIRSQIYQAIEIGEKPMAWFEEKLPPEFMEAVLKYGPEDSWLVQRGKVVLLGAQLMNHAHVDHAGVVQGLSGVKKILTSDGVWATLIALSAYRRDLRYKHDVVVDVTEKGKGNGYPRTPVEAVVTSSPDDEVFIAGGAVSVQCPPTDHSIFSNAIALKGPDIRPTLLTGDLAAGPMTEAMAEQFAGQIEVIVTEATNYNSNKPGQSLSESQLIDSYINTISKRPGHMIVVAAPTNHISRMRVIAHAAEATGRKVVFDPRHASFLTRMHRLQQEFHLNSPFRKVEIPVVGVDGDVYRPLKDRFTTDEQWLFRQMELIDLEDGEEGELGPVISSLDLGRHPGDFILVTSTYDPAPKMYSGFGLHNHKTTHIVGGPRPYEFFRIKEAKDNFKWMQDQGIEIVADWGFERGQLVVKPHPEGVKHTGGHASFQYLVDKVLYPLADARHEVDIIVTHTSNPQKAGKAMEARFEELSRLEQRMGTKKHGGKRVKVIHNLDHYDHLHPFYDKPQPDSPLMTKGFYHSLTRR